MWGGGTDIEEYEIYVGRFNSEYGMQSMPEYSSILKYTGPEDRTIDSYILRQSFLKVFQNGFYIFTELDNIVSFVHLEREDDAFLTIVFHIRIGVWILTLDGRDVA